MLTGLQISSCIDIQSNKILNFQFDVIWLINIMQNHWRQRNIFVSHYSNVYGVSNHRHLDCLLNHLFRRRSKKTSKLCITGLWEGINRSSVDSPHKGPITRKMFPFDDVIMTKTKQCEILIAWHVYMLGHLSTQWWLTNGWIAVFISYATWRIETNHLTTVPVSCGQSVGTHISRDIYCRKYLRSYGLPSQPVANMYWCYVEINGSVHGDCNVTWAIHFHHAWRHPFLCSFIAVPDRYQYMIDRHWTTTLHGILACRSHTSIILAYDPFIPVLCQYIRWRRKAFATPRVIYRCFNAIQQ